MPELSDSQTMALARAVELLMRAASEPGREAPDRLDLTTAAIDLIAIVDPEAVHRALQPLLPTAMDVMLTLGEPSRLEYWDRLTTDQQAAVLDIMRRREEGESTP